jgi:polysaccharide biosynthesis protein PslH
LLAAKRQKATHLILEFPYYGLAGVICKKLLGLNLIIHCHNIEFLRFREQKKSWWRLLYFLEKWTLQKADSVFVKTPKDRRMIAQFFGITPSRIAVIPYAMVINGPFEKEESRKLIIQRHELKSDEKLLLFAGTLDYLPNAEAVLAIYKFLVPLLEEKSVPFRFIICGRNQIKAFQYLKDLHNKHVVYAGEVVDIETYFQGCDVFVNPVQSGEGIQTKIYDALSYHCNVVAFESMLSKDEQLKSINKVYTVNDQNWTDFANKIIEASSNKALISSEFLQKNSWYMSAEKAIMHLQMSK